MQSMSAIQGMAATGTMQGLPGGAFPYNGQSPQQMQGMTPLAGMQALQNLQGMAAMQLGLPANSLQGNVQQQQSMQALQALKFLQNAQPDLPSLRMAPPATRPDWLPGYAYTNDYMVAPYHNFDLSPWDKSKIPQHRKVIRLSESVTKFWHGDVSQPCLISLEPLAQAPGNFSFASEEPNGPRGWLQDTNEANSKGYPIYRYWFAQSR